MTVSETATSEDNDQAGELVGVEEISEEDKSKLEEIFHLKEAEGRKHRMVKAVEGKKKFNCTRCGLRSLYDKVQENRERSEDVVGHWWRD